MSKLIAEIEKRQLRKVPDFRPGDRVKVHFQIREGGRTRIQIFEGVVLKRQGSGARETFTVRKTSFGVGVQRMFPVHSPKVERIEIKGRGEVRRSKLYYLRGRIGRKARVREKFDADLGEPVGDMEEESEEAAESEGEEQEAEDTGETTGEEQVEKSEEVTQEAERDESAEEEAVDEEEAADESPDDDKGATEAELKEPEEEKQSEEPGVAEAAEKDPSESQEGNSEEDKNSDPDESSSQDRKD